MPAQADIGANGAVWIGLETVYGTPVDPTAAGVGVWMPIMDENLVYTEAKYYSEQIRQQAVVSDVEQAYYHVAGNLHFEVDAHYLPYLMYASRHTTAKTGAGTPWTYTSTPAGLGATYPGAGTKTGFSCYILRDGIGFLYSGCVVNDWSFTINNGVLECTAGILGLAEQDPATNVPTTSWVDASLFGASAHSVYVDTAGLTPTFATRNLTFNGYTFHVNHNGEAQNRIQPTRSANYIKYGVTDVEVTSELDFLDKTEYTNFKNATLRAIRLVSIKPGGLAGTFAAATEGVQITVYRSAYDQYDVSLRSMADIVAATVTMKGLNISGGTAYKIECISTASIT
jgi:hypothetical protein